MAVYVKEQRWTENTKWLHSDDEMVVFFSFFKMVFKAGVTLTIEKEET